MPMGVHAWNEQVQYQNQFMQTITEIHPVIRRNLDPDVPVVSGWAATAAPLAQQAITITSPSNNQLVDSAMPIPVNVSSSGPFSLQLDGQTISSPIVNPVDGWHLLVAVNASAPQFRHTLRFETRRLTVPPDAFETDDSVGVYTALYEGAPHQHNFHKSLDTDWTAFAVGGSTRSTVKLAGQVAHNTSLKLYRQINYPTGSIDLIATQSNMSNQLVVSNDSAADMTTVYYVEAKPTSSSTYGPGSEYTLSVATAPVDSFESDDIRENYTPLHEGAPQTHTFHHVSDSDWVAYAVGPGVTSRVTLEGVPAAASIIEMYHHVNYPDGALVQVDTSANMPGILSVQHTAPTNEAFSVYYVRARPRVGNTSAVGSSYVLSVTTE
jgi:hypothetical protein